MKLNPDKYPDGFQPIQKGETITYDCKMWSIVNEIWIPVSTTIVGKRYDPHEFIVLIARPSPLKRK